MHSYRLRAILGLVWVAVSLAHAQPDHTERFDALNGGHWKVAFTASDSDWTTGWFLDGERGFVKNTADGMVFSAGPIRGDHGSHNVLWTRREFEGDVKIEFDYTRLDDLSYAVNILYVQATGVGVPPYHEDISRWSDLRVVPYMHSYFRHMNLLHISYAAYPQEDDPDADYVRARRYPVPPGGRFSDTRVAPDYFNTGLFKPGVTYHFTVIKKGDDLVLRVVNDEVDRVFAWDTSEFAPISKGRIGIRHMYTRAARYGNFTVYVAE